MRSERGFLGMIKAKNSKFEIYDVITVSMHGLRTMDLVQLNDRRHSASDRNCFLFEFLPKMSENSQELEDPDELIHFRDLSKEESMNLLKTFKARVKQKEKEKEDALKQAAKDKEDALKQAAKDKEDALKQAAKQAAKDKKDALKQATRSGLLLERGLPPLGEYSFKGSFTSLPSIGKEEARFTVIPSSFKELDAIPLADAKSALWDLALSTNDETLGLWNSEQDVQSRCLSVLKEVAMIGNIFKELSFVLEAYIGAFSRFRADIAGIRNRLGQLITVAEVKQPSKNGKDLETPEIINQIGDYLHDLRFSWGVQFVVGLVTTYREWRIVWLSDCQDFAQTTSSEEFSACQLGELLQDRLYASETFRYDDPGLVKLLVSVITKAFRTKIIPPANLNLFERKFCCFSTDQQFRVSWQTFDTKIVFSYNMPAKNTKKFMIIRAYHPGRDGKVFLASSANGKFVVMKFLNPEKKELEKVSNAEANAWISIWNCKKVRMVEWFDHKVILMPFVFHCRQGLDGNPLGFMPADLWTLESPINVENLLSNKNIVENRKFETEPLKTYVEAPTLALEQALKALAAKCRVHRDIEWRHLALLPVEIPKKWLQKESRWTVTPIMIDLTGTRNARSPQDAIELMAPRFQALTGKILQN